MPLTHIATFQVWFHQCDVYSHLNNAVYVRYLQEAAFQASAAAGYDMNRYAEIHRQWWTRATEIEYLCPVRYGDTVQVKTWVADIRRASSRRMYEMYLAGSDDLVARGFTDWVLLNTDTGRPVSVPPEMGTAFFPEGLPEAFSDRQPFPGSPPPPADIFTTRLQVQWRDLDPVGHVNNAAYLDYLTEAGIRVVEHYGWPWTRMREQGFAILLRKHQIQYLRPALLGDELEISTWVYGVRRSTAGRYYAIRRAKDGEMLAQVHTLGVWVDLNTGRPIRIPPQLLEDFAANVVDP